MLVSMSLDHRRAGLSTRERFHLGDERVVGVYESLASAGAKGAVVAQTCNRLEAYCWWPAPEGQGAAGKRDAVAREICRAWVGGDDGIAEEMRRFAVIETGAGAVEHLLRVASGLESQVLGDIHVLAQLRQAFRKAIELDRTNSQLHRLFEVAFRLGKRVKRETGLMATRSGVGSEAARVALGVDGGAGLIVVGCGKIGSQAVRELVARGVRDVMIVNRTLHRAEALSRQLGAGVAMDLDRLPELLRHARAVIVATDANEHVLTEALVSAARSAEGSRSPLAIVDVSVPRNVEPAVGKLGGVTLIDLDTLHPETSGAVAIRRAAIPKAEGLVAESRAEYLRWLELESARLALHPLRAVLAEVCRREIAFVTGETRASDRAADRIVARVMAHPMTTLRSACERGEDMSEPVAVLGSLFA